MIESVNDILLTRKFENSTDLRREAGFTLVEVLIAISIFAVGLLAVAIMLDTAIQYNASARFINEATEIAHSQMEQLMNSPYDGAGLDEASSPHGPNPVAKYKVSWVIRENIPITAIKTINLTVTWDDRGESKNLTINALKQ